MGSIVSHWLPILVSAVVVFIVSFIIHTVLGYRKNDIARLPKEDDVMAALRPFQIPPGDYGFPRPNSMKEMKNPEFAEKMKAGPVGFLTVVPSGPPSMGSSLVLWFIYSVVVGIFAAYVTGHALPPGASFRGVFRFVGCTAFLGYGLALVQNSIWRMRRWGATILSLVDAVIYGALTACVFGWLWPR